MDLTKRNLSPGWLYRMHPMKLKALCTPETLIIVTLNFCTLKKQTNPCCIIFRHPRTPAIHSEGSYAGVWGRSGWRTHANPAPRNPFVRTRRPISMRCSLIDNCVGWFAKGGFKIKIMLREIGFFFVGKMLCVLLNYGWSFHCDGFSYFGYVIQVFVGGIWREINLKNWPFSNQIACFKNNFSGLDLNMFSIIWKASCIPKGWKLIKDRI